MRPQGGRAGKFEFIYRTDSEEVDWISRTRQLKLKSRSRRAI